MNLAYKSLGVLIKRTNLITSAKSAVFGLQNLPPDLGSFDEVTDLVEGDNVFGKVFVGNYEPFWIDLREIWGEAAVLLSVQNVNPRTGQAAFMTMAKPQNYYILPDDQWVDGWSVRPGVVSQFVFVPGGSGLEVADYVLPEYLKGNKIAIAIFRPNPNYMSGQVFRGAVAKGVGHAGQIKQYHADDQRNLNYWKVVPSAVFTYEIVNRPPEHRPQPRHDDGFLHGVPPAA